MADIGTSFAKVFGDVWQSLWMLKPGNSILRPPVDDTWLRWILPMMMRYVQTIFIEYRVVDPRYFQRAILAQIQAVYN